MKELFKVSTDEYLKSLPYETITGVTAKDFGVRRQKEQRATSTQDSRYRIQMAERESEIQADDPQSVQGVESGKKKNDTKETLISSQAGGEEPTSIKE